jgi:hypothetical protein
MGHCSIWISQQLSIWKERLNSDGQQYHQYQHKFFNYNIFKCKKLCTILYPVSTLSSNFFKNFVIKWNWCRLMKWNIYDDIFMSQDYHHLNL